jgi:hypothetical protein
MSGGEFDTVARSSFPDDVGIRRALDGRRPMPRGMYTDTRALLRGVAALGATIAFLATFFPWYLFEVVFPTGRVTHVFAVSITLWNFTTLAPVLITLGAVVTLACLTLVASRWAGAVEALVGLGILVYAIVRGFDVPDLGVSPGGRVDAATDVGGGTFLAIAGGLMVLIGSLGDLLLSPGEPEGAAETPEPGARFERGAPRPTRGVTP